MGCLRYDSAPKSRCQSRFPVCADKQKITMSSASEEVQNRQNHDSDQQNAPRELLRTRFHLFAPNRNQYSLIVPDQLFFRLPPSLALFGPAVRAFLVGEKWVRSLSSEENTFKRMVSLNLNL